MKQTKLISALLGITMLISSFYNFVYADGEYDVKVKYNKSEDRYTAEAKYEYPADITESLWAILAIYNEEGALKSLRVNDIVPGEENNADISGIEVQEGDAIKGMLWRKADMHPLTDADECKVIDAVPTDTPASIPTAEPTLTVTSTPTAGPTSNPTENPVWVSTASPTAAATSAPTATPTTNPTAIPTTIPAATPTATPSAISSFVPAATPSALPTVIPTELPVETPSATASVKPTESPVPVQTATPAVMPTATPAITPPVTPTILPTTSPEATSDPNHWDFAEYVDGISALGNVQEDYRGLEIHLASGDSISEEGLYWSQPSGIKSDSKTTVSNNRYIVYKPNSNGTLSITYKGAVNTSSKHPRIYVSCGESLACTTKDANSSQLEPNMSYDNNSTDYKTAQFKLSQGKTYYIWSYYYNTSSNQFTISDIAFEAAQVSVRTRNIYGSNMLLQRGKSFVIDGKADAADSVSLTLYNDTADNAVQTVKSNAISQNGSWTDREWSAAFDAVSDYSSTYKLVISAEGMDDIVYNNILFGDLYLFTGQSNMWKQVSYYRNIDKAAYGTDAVAANATDKIRVMHTAGEKDTGTNVLQYDAKGAQAWRDFSSYSNVSDIAAPAYTAAVKMYKETGIPIGCVTNAYPGSYISSWFDSALAIDNCNLGKNGNMNERNWYCGRIYPLRNLNLSGVFWYQGEADAATTYHDNPYEYYSEMLPKLIDTWRELFRDDKLPFYYVQLSRIGSTIVDENNPDTGAAGKMPIKRAQTDVYLDTDDKTNIGIISTLDLYGNHTAGAVANCRTDIHLGQKNIVGERMAAYALKDIYKKSAYSDGSAVYSHGPMYKSSEVRDGKIVITFDCSGQLSIMPSSQYTDTTGEQKIEDGEFDPAVLNEFEVAGADGEWYAASAEITANDQITVSSSGVAEPVKVRYCGKDYPESPNLTDASGMPSYVFEKTADNTGDQPAKTEEPAETGQPSETEQPIETEKPQETQMPSETEKPTETENPSEETPDIIATYKFDFGNSEPAQGYKAVTPDKVYDMSASQTAREGTLFGFLGITDNSYADDILPYDCDKRAIDGFTLVKGQRIDLTSGGVNSETDADSDYIAVPAKDNYIPSTASNYEGRFPIRFSMKADRKAYYTITATLANSSIENDACVSLFSEKRQIIAENVSIKPNEKIKFKFNVDIEDKAYKNFSSDFYDDMLNICVSGENAAISSLIVEKHGKTEGKIKGTAANEGVNDGVTMWLCTDSTGCDYGAKVPFFALQSYGGVGQALSKYAPENIAISNQGEGGLSTASKTHFNNCLLKEGDYLYVQYGHNESGADKYKSNLEEYYTRAHGSGAKLIVVSPINRHKSGDFSGGKWQSSFGGYVTAGREFVNAKIDGGADDIAFVDLNTLYVDWMNEETSRITAINPQIAAQAAMNFYYFSEKGTIVDGAHINDAGADHGAYCFFEAAKNIVEASKAADADKYTKAQAEVVRPLVEGMKTTVGDSNIPNLPMTVSDEIINAGVAPNAYWDTVPSEFFNYDNAIAVDSVGTVTHEDGSMEISSVGIRLMNQITYAKAVVMVNDNGTETKYYTESNYDCTGAEQGTVKENHGFITVDRNHNEVTDSEKIETITVPKGASCTVRIFECDEYWVVGDNKAISAVYNVYPEEKTVFEESGASTDGWKTLAGVSSHTETVTEDTDGSKYLAIYSTGVDNSNTKKNYGFYKALDENISTGKYRMSFKTRFGAGVIRFALVNSVASASNPFSSKVYPLMIDTGKIYMNAAANPIYTLTNDEDTRENKINADQWLNVDSIVDLSEGRFIISVGGSDYAEFDIADWQNSDPTTLPIRYFGIAGGSEGAPASADVKDIKITKLSVENTAKRTIKVNVNDSAMGNTLINGIEASHMQVDVSSAVTLKAVANEGYKFVNWTDNDGNELSQAAEYQIPRMFTDTEVTANFEGLASNETIWNFSGYADSSAINAASAQNEAYNGLTIGLNSGDSITPDGIYWAKKGGSKSDDTTSVSNNRYIKYTAPAEGGTLKVTIKAASVSSTTRLYLSKGTDISCTTKNSGTGKDIAKANTDTVCEYTLEGSETYFLWTWITGDTRESAFTVSNISFTAATE